MRVTVPCRWVAEKRGCRIVTRSAAESNRAEAQLTAWLRDPACRPLATPTRRPRAFSCPLQPSWKLPFSSWKLRLALEGAGRSRIFSHPDRITLREALVRRGAGSGAGWLWVRVRLRRHGLSAPHCATRPWVRATRCLPRPVCARPCHPGLPPGVEKVGGHREATKSTFSGFARCNGNLGPRGAL